MSELPDHYRITVRLEQVFKREPDQHGFVRTDAETLADLTLTGGTEGNVLRQAHQHVGTLVEAYVPVAVNAPKKGGYQ